MKEVKRESVWNYPGMYVKEDIINSRPQYIIEAFKRKTLYFINDALMIRNNVKYISNYFKLDEQVKVGDYLIQDEDGILYKVDQEIFKSKYKIIEE